MMVFFNGFYSFFMSTGDFGIEIVGVVFIIKEGNISGTANFVA